jgi:spore germination protein GerM
MKTKKLFIAWGVLVIVISGALIVINLKPASEKAPVNLKPTNGTSTLISDKSGLIKVKVFFNNNKLDPEVSCLKVFPVEREIVKTSALAQAALTELLTGTTPTETEAGFATSLNPNIKIQSLTIENKVAKVDFDEQLGSGVGGSCRVTAIRAQISETLKQFSSVKSVIISINGRSEDILQP